MRAKKELRQEAPFRNSLTRWKRYTREDYIETQPRCTKSILKHNQDAQNDENIAQLMNNFQKPCTTFRNSEIEEPLEMKYYLQ